jgi:hypothetical protein
MLAKAIGLPNFRGRIRPDVAGRPGLRGTYVMSVAVRTWWHKVGVPPTPSMRRPGKRFMVGMAIGRHRRPTGAHKELFLVTGTVGGSSSTFRRFR